MGIVYHGSKEHNLKKIAPRKSTHGTYVYATQDKALAIHFSKRCGDDLTYGIGNFSKENGPWELIEKIPGAFEKMYSNASSLYTLNDATFKDIKTGFNEVVSETPVDVIDEEYYDNVYEAILNLEREGLIKIYRYPNKPKGVPVDSSDILDKWRYYKQNLGREFRWYEFDRLFFLHPYLLDKINELANEFQYDFHYEERDLIAIFQKEVDVQLNGLQNERYIDCAYQSICDTFPLIAEDITKIYTDYTNQINQKKL
ncbi:MAG: hypothetical protein K2I70_02415 [Bacilli bacterium]|nr:hypothetical protein [Bacilli bacterium]